MWSSDPTRRRFLAGLVSLTALAACGFTPVHGRRAGLIGAVRIGTSGTSNRFDVNRRLNERLGPVQDARWDLTYTISTGSEAFAANPSRRVQETGTLSYVLAPLVPDAPRITGKVSAFASHTDALNSATDTSAILSNAASARDVRKRLMVMLADRAITDMQARLHATSS